MARKNQNNAVSANAQLAKDASKLTLASLRKRGVELTSHELHLAVLYSRMNSLSWSVLKGTMDSATATAEANKAYADYQRLEQPQPEAVEAF